MQKRLKQDQCSLTKDTGICTRVSHRVPTNIPKFCVNVSNKAATGVVNAEHGQAQASSLAAAPIRPLI